MMTESHALLLKASRALCVASALHCASCASPGTRFHQDATRRGFEAQTQSSVPTPLTVYRKGAPASGAPIHVYLDGDGTPWLSKRRIARDPTSRERLILDLMERDGAASVLVGRPCYYQQETECDAAWWTEARYANRVVARVAEAINVAIEPYATSPVTLIGYSGGGTLAMLVAPRLARLDTVITLAANLDVAAWARYHGYAPLRASEDPADYPPLAADIRQVHFFGGDDDNVPASVVRHVADRQQAAQVEIVSGFDHRCCWADAWPGLLSRALAPEPRDAPD